MLLSIGLVTLYDKVNKSFVNNVAHGAAFTFISSYQLAFAGIICTFPSGWSGLVELT